jgi:hypothetical protein
MKGTVFATVLAVALAAPLTPAARADRADDDLAAVKKAVGGTVAEARPAAEKEAEKEEARPARPAKRDGKWLRVRVTERGGKHGKVSVNLPLGLARAFGEDWPIRGSSRCEEGHRLTLGDVLRALDSGQSLVEIDDEEASVRVWVD